MDQYLYYVKLNIDPAKRTIRTVGYSYPDGVSITEISHLVIRKCTIPSISPQENAQ